MIRKRLYVVLILAALVSFVFADTRQHLVRPGDTLYSLAKKYEVTVEAIQAANPTIEGTNIQVGMTLEIPEATTASAAAVTSNEEPEKKGFFAKIFGKKKNKKEAKQTEIVEEEEIQQEEEETPEVNPRQKQPGTSDNIVVIMPFNLAATSGDAERQQMRAVEFYEGLLLAIKEAQAAGQRILVQTYDLGTKSMGEILATQSLMDADLIVAPMELSDVQPIAEFAKQWDINVVSPFVYSQELSADNKNLVQVNTPKSLVYENLTNDVLRRFRDYDFVFIKDETSTAKPDPYADYLRGALKDKDVKYYEFPYSNPEKLASVDTTLNIIGHNILYIQEINTRETLQKMFPCLKCTTFEDEEKKSGNAGQTAVLGYPEWVLYTGDFMEYYYDLNVHIFSKFYINPFDEEVKKFNSDFRYWYAKEPMPLTPRYALLGFDVGRYFLAALSRFGREMNLHFDTFQRETLQTMMSFRNEGEGLVNKGLYLVHFMPSAKIEKYEIK